jgi:hypothetical protein
MLIAIIPAILYYIAIFLAVDMEAVRLGLSGVAKENKTSFREVFKASICFCSRCHRGSSHHGKNARPGGFRRNGLHGLAAAVRKDTA